MYLSLQENHISPYPLKPINQANMMDIWSWICELPNWDDRLESDPSLVFTLASDGKMEGDSARSIQLIAEFNSEALMNFKITFQGFQSSDAQKPLWISDPCSLSSEQPFLPLVLQLLQETINRSPAMPNRSQLAKLKPEPISWIMESHSPESFSSLFNLVLLIRLFWLCACDAPSEVGSFYFEYLLGPNIEAVTCKQATVLRAFLVSIGVDTELCFMRTFGYMVAKWTILREVSVGLQTLISPLPGKHLGVSYATEAHGLWTLKGYAPVNAMKVMHSSDVIGAKGSLLRYALAHQQLEAVIQLEYSVEFYDGYIQVNARVDNLRFHVAKLGFSKKKNDDTDDFLDGERHFPSRIRVWVGPEVGSTYVSGLTLGRSTNNGEREVETQRIVKGSLGKSKASPEFKARERVSIKNKMKSWRWDQDAEGNAAVFDAMLCDNVTGHEIATCKSFNNGKGGNSFQHRYYGANRPFTKAGGLVFAGDDYGEGVGWRLSRDMEGSVLKWRIGGEVWLSYWPNNVKSSYVETRCVEWCDEVDLPLIPLK